jgi:Tfp pilus assembly protein FimT
MAAGLVVVIVIAGLIVALAVALLVGGAERRERAADLALEFWDWLKLGR